MFNQLQPKSCLKYFSALFSSLRLRKLNDKERVNTLKMMTELILNLAGSLDFDEWINLLQEGKENEELG